MLCEKTMASYIKKTDVVFCHLSDLNRVVQKNQSSPDNGELDGEVVRQLGELARSEAAAQATFVAGDQLASWASPEFTSGHGDFGIEAASTTVPSCEV